MSPIIKLIRLAAVFWAVLLLSDSRHSLAAGDWYVDEFIPGPVAAQVLRVIDGDTIVVRARIWLDQDLKTGIRLRGVDTPELNSKCQDEKDQARKARDFVQGLVSGKIVLLRDIDYDKFARRVVANVQIPKAGDLSKALIDNNFGRNYDGGKRLPWCLEGGAS